MLQNPYKEKMWSVSEKSSAFNETRSFIAVFIEDW
jgi:hypothetical protein